jgi:hypothetical protein
MATFHCLFWKGRKSLNNVVFNTSAENSICWSTTDHADDGGSKHPCNVSLCLRDCTNKHPRRQVSSYLPRWEHEIPKFPIEKADGEEQMVTNNVKKSENVKNYYVNVTFLQHDCFFKTTDSDVPDDQEASWNIRKYILETINFRIIIHLIKLFFTMHLFTFIHVSFFYYLWPVE